MSMSRKPESQPDSRIESVSRRTTLKMGASLATALVTPAIVHASAPHKRTLRMQSLNSGESLTVTYWADGKYLAEADAPIAHFMRDLRSHEVHPIDRRLLDFMWEVDELTPSTNPLYTLSGFRSASTNALLVSRSEDVDSNSFHLRGMAIDLTQDFLDPEALFRVARSLKRGGTGFYPTDRPFVHMDVGPVDVWIWPEKGRPNRAAEYDRMMEPAAKG